MKKYIMLGVALVFCFSTTLVFAEPVVSINPSYAQRKLKSNGEHNKIRMHVELSGAVNLLSAGAKLTYDMSQFTVIEHHKNDTIWNTGIDSYVDGNGVFFVGGSTTPVSGDKILLGWVVFQFTGCPDDMPKNVQLTVDLAKDPLYDNFVDKDGNVKDGDLTFGGATVCLVHPDVDACEGDFDGNSRVNRRDRGIFKDAYSFSFPMDSYNPACDFNTDGRVNRRDRGVFKLDYGRDNCPSCN